MAYVLSQLAEVTVRGSWAPIASVAERMYRSTRRKALSALESRGLIELSKSETELRVRLTPRGQATVAELRSKGD